MLAILALTAPIGAADLAPNRPISAGSAQSGAERERTALGPDQAAEEVVGAPLQLLPKKLRRVAVAKRVPARPAVRTAASKTVEPRRFAIAAHGAKHRVTEGRAVAVAPKVRRPEPAAPALSQPATLQAPALAPDESRAIDLTPPPDWLTRVRHVPLRPSGPWGALR